MVGNKREGQDNMWEEAGDQYVCQVISKVGRFSVISNRGSSSY